MSNQPENRFPGPKPPKPIIECRDNKMKKILATFSKDANRSITNKKTKDR